MADHHPESRLERAAESTLAKLGARIVVPTLLAILGTLLVWIGRDLQDSVKEQGRDIVGIQSDVRDINTRLNAQVLRQVESNTQKLEQIDERVQRIERRFGEP